MEVIKVMFQTTNQTGITWAITVGVFSPPKLPEIEQGAISSKPAIWVPRAGGGVGT
jgi:hypothetical protein